MNLVSFRKPETCELFTSQVLAISLSLGWNVLICRKLLHNLLTGNFVSGRSPNLKLMYLYYLSSIFTSVSSDLGTFHEPIHSKIFLEFL